MHRLIQHALAHELGVPVAVGQHRVDCHALFRDERVARAQRVVADGADRRDELQAHFRSLRRAAAAAAAAAALGDFPREFDELLHRFELGLEGLDRAGDAHRPGVVHDVGYGVGEVFVLVAWQAEVWFGGVGLEHFQLGEGFGPE